MTREELFALREAVARIEGKPVHAARDWARQAERQAAEATSPPGPVAEKEARDGEFLQLLQETIGKAGSFLEVRNPSLMQAGGASGFALALALMAPGLKTGGRILQIGDRETVREAGLPYAPGLADFGLQSAQVVHALPRRIEDALWLADTALSSRAFAAVLLEVHGNPRHFGLTESRRLSLTARAQGGLLVVVRHGGEEEASSAALRLKLSPAPAAGRVLFDNAMPGGSIGNSVFHVTVEKSRTLALFDLLVEWSPHDRRLYPVSADTPRQQLYPAHPVLELSAPVHGPDRPAAVGGVLAFDRAS
nr:hypothetical protein [Rhizobium halophytocola]